MPYTPHDTAAVIARIERDLDDVVRTVTAGDPHLKALVLTGGFARGEGSMQNGEPLNDYDLVAIRSPGRVRVPYAVMRQQLEDRLGLHMDLCAVPSWRLRLVSNSIFWYETGRRGRVLWGKEILDRIPIRDAARIEPTEGMRLLVNRAAGLLLATGKPDPLNHQIQAAKALLAAADVHLLAAGAYAPSQRERWTALHALPEQHEARQAAAAMEPWLSWAFDFKINADRARRIDPDEAWQAAADAVRAAVPVGLTHAGCPSLDAFARRDTMPGRVFYQLRAGSVPGARRMVAHPTGQLRAATLRLLEVATPGNVPQGDLRRWLAPMVKPQGEALDAFDALRGATLQ